ncbi:MAG TPA: peptidase [Mucilaginibacter sp.]|nr:peptidase [Mucilaginibacter sp.]
MALLIIISLIALAAYFFVKKMRSGQPVKNQELAESYEKLLNEHVHFYQKLSDTGKVRFQTMIQDFLQYVRIEGVGIEVTVLDRVLVAASGVIPIFGFPDWKYKNLTNVILYPDTFDKEFQFDGENRNIMGMVGSGNMNGQMLLSRAALVKGFSISSGAGNTAIHEFVHLLDKADGATDGIPESLMAHEYAVPWLKMMHSEMHRIEKGNSDINPYALTDEAEFLAVTAEYFFEKPEELQHKHPELYQQLSQIFGQSPDHPDHYRC